MNWASRSRCHNASAAISCGSSGTSSARLRIAATCRAKSATEPTVRMFDTLTGDPGSINFLQPLLSVIGTPARESFPKSATIVLQGLPTPGRLDQTTTKICPEGAR